MHEPASFLIPCCPSSLRPFLLGGHLSSSGLQIRYHEAFLNGNKLCVVMEYAPFGDLRYYITKGQRLNAPFPEEAIWRIFLQLCRWVQKA